MVTESEPSLADAFQFADDVGPAKVLFMLEPALGLRAIPVVDNVAAGPAIGGVRMAGDVSREERVRLARSNAAPVLEGALRGKIRPRQAAMNLALQRVRRAMPYRRWP